MATMNVSLPEELRVRVDTLVKSGQYQTNSDYIRDPIRRDLTVRREAERLDQLLEKGLEGPFHPFDEPALADLEETLLAELDSEG